MAAQMTIIGLGKIGASMGLALASQKSQLYRVGHDRSPEAMRRAEKLGAVDKNISNLHSAVEKAELVILAIPVDEIREVLELIGPDLEEGAVVVSTAADMNAVSDWAKEFIPQGRYFVTMSMTLNPETLMNCEHGINAARADLFKKSLAAIASPRGTDPDAIKLASDLAGLLGANPYFTDALEFDGLNAAVEQLPTLLSAALVNAASDQPGWTESQKIAGHAFSLVSEPTSHPDEYKETGKGLLLNKENLVRMLDAYTNALSDLRQALVDEDAEQIKKLLEQAQIRRERWLQQRTANDWGGVIPTPPIPTKGEIFGRLIGLRSKKVKK